MAALSKDLEQNYLGLAQNPSADNSGYDQWIYRP